MAVNPSIQLGTSGNWAIKEDNLLAYKQLGNKFFDREFDFSRGTRATFVGRNGLIQESGLTSAELVTNGDFSQEGPELITNGDFSNGSTDWSVVGLATISNSVASFVDNGTNGNAYINQNVFTVGKFYKVTFDITRYVAGRIQLQVNSLYSVDISGGVGTYTTYVESDNIRLLIKRDGAYPNYDFDIDNVSVKEVGQDWTFFGEAEFTDNGARIYSSSGGQSYITQDALNNTKSYKLSYEITDSTQGGLKLINVNGLSDYPIASSVGIHTEYFTANNNALFIYRNSGATDVTITNISVKEIQTDVPRIDFTDDPTGHLLLEPQSTNLVSYSEDFNNNYWSHNANVTTTNSLELAPNGKLDAQILKYDGTGYSFIRRSLPSIPSTAVTLSVFAKKGNWRYLGFRTFQMQGSSHTTFDFDTETFVNIDGTQTGSFETFSNGWYRIKVNEPSPNAANNLVGFALSNSSGGELNTTGGQVANVHLFGAQLEESSYATSYIPTSGSAVTRNQELCNNSGTVNDFNSEEGVLYAEIAALADDLTFREISTSDGTINNTVELRFRNASNNIQALVRSINGTVQVGIGSSAYTITSFNKIAFKYKLNDFALWINGVKVVTDTSGVTPIGLSELAFDDGNGNNLFFGKTKNLKVFKRALTDAELYLLTVTQYQSYQEMATALNYTL